MCTWCAAELEVGKSAQSLVCPHCNQRLVVEDFRTATYHAVRQVATCGDVFIDKRGHVVAAVKASNVTVVGRLEGNVRARGRVEIRATAQVKGDIVAPSLRVESGATLEGSVRIGVEASDE